MAGTNIAKPFFLSVTTTIYRRNTEPEMRMLKGKKQGFIIIHNEELSFITADQKKCWECIESIPLSGFLDPETIVEIPLKKIKDYDFSLMIVPDFWFGNRNFDFNSNDRNAIESFISRKLKQEFPKTPEIQNLFSYKIIKHKKEKQELASLFIQAPEAGEILKALAGCNIKPARISSPALLWNQRLADKFDSFSEEGFGLVYLLEGECILLFYHMGSFLFSRTIPLPESGDGYVSKFESLSFEINQSAYHFSQRTKSQLNKLFLISRENSDLEQVKEVIGRDISILDENYGCSVYSDELLKRLGLFADFTTQELFPPEKVHGISDRILKNETEVRKIQLGGIIAGIFLFLFLGAEFLFLNNVSSSENKLRYSGEENPKEKIEQYNNALDILLYDAEKEKPMTTIGRLAASLPENISFETIEIEMEPSHSLSFKGKIKASDVEEFNRTLTDLVANINQNIKCSGRLSIDDLNIELAGSHKQLDYNISFNLELI